MIGWGGVRARALDVIGRYAGVGEGCVAGVSAAGHEVLIVRRDSGGVWAGWSGIHIKVWVDGEEEVIS